MTASIAGSTQDLVEVSTRRRVANWKRKRIAFLLLPLLVGLCFLFFVLFIIFQVKYSDLLKEEVCTTKDCIDSANTLLQVMDLKKDPCADFFAYSCGNFAQEHPLVDDSWYRSFFDEGEDRISRMVMGVLEEDDTNTTSDSLKNTRNLYRSCINTERLEQLGLRRLYELLEKVGLPKYPTKDTADDFNLGKTLGLIQRYIDMDIIVQLGLIQGELHPGESNTSFIMKISPSVSSNNLQLLHDAIDIDLPRNFENIQKLYLDRIRRDPSTFDASASIYPNQILIQKLLFMGTILKIIFDDVNNGSPPEGSEIEIVKDSVKIMTFTASLAKIVQDETNVTEENSASETMTLADLQAVLDDPSPSDLPGNKIIWKDYLNEVFGGEKGYWTYDYNEDLLVINTVSAFKKLVAFLGDTKPVTIQRYIWWTLVNQFARFTTNDMMKAYERLHENIMGRSPVTSRRRICVAYVRKLLHFPVAKEVKNKFGLANQTREAIEMFDDIKDEFENLVHDLNWMDRRTKLLNIRKAKAINNFIGYESPLLDDNTVDEHYKDLNMAEDEFLLNMAGLKQWEMQKSIKILKQENATILGVLMETTNPLQVNAYYARHSNSIYVPAGILQRPFYFRGLQSMNYGAIGSILGHELTHGFDFEGKDYDVHGKRQDDLWSQEITAQYVQRADCFVDQYSQFNISKIEKLDGKVTLSENIADNGGMRQAYYAYQSYLKRHGREPKLPGFEHFTPEQLLFISYATVWCETSTPLYDQVAHSDDNHSPNKIRVIATLQNMKEFSEAFKCPAASSMNPSKKCVIW